MPAPRTTVVRFEIAPRSIVLVLAALAGVWLAWQLWVVELILLVALILAGTFNPLIEWMERRGLGRTSALLLLLVLLLIALGGFLVLTVPPLTEQIVRMVQNAPATRARLVTMLQGHPFAAPLSRAVQSAELHDTFGQFERYLLGYLSKAVEVVGYAATTLVLSFYLLADGKRMQGVAYAIVPREYHMRLARILQNMETIVGGYMRGQFITCLAIGVFVYLLLFICRVPNALSIALFAGLVDLLPFIGGLLVIVPAVLAAVPVGLPVAGVVLGALLIYMEFESRILVPRVYGSVLRLPSTAVILALIAGGLLMGVIGALLALPVASGLLMALEELRVEMPGDDSIDESTRARDAKVDAVYEKMSAGATAPDAGEIASNLAHAEADETPKT